MRKQMSQDYKMFLQNIFFPNRCPCCGQLIPWRDYLCETCTWQMDQTEDIFCPRYGKRPSECLCSDDLPYDRALIVALYHGVAKNGILSMKRAESVNFAKYCAIQLSERILQDTLLQSSDCIVPVPMGKWKKLKRCLNPAEALAKELSRLSHIPLRKDILWDDGTGKMQHLLSAEERLHNLTHFRIRNVDLTGYRVLLCDDVLTTDSTMRHCAGLLKSKGASQVVAVSMTATELEHTTRRADT
ncbi:MAG: double zinc ribbon domain-containing protein [Ruminococcus sp.]|nr:double zinc ribbon domain-containing protein [Ruminococcus sp.]